MVTIRIIDRITDLLRDSGLSWLLPDLRQDFVVWNALNDPAFLEKVIQSKPAEKPFLPADFSPSRLALLALGQPGLTAEEPQNLLDSMDDQAIQMTMRRFNDQAHLQPAPQELASAGLIALILLNNFDASKSWNGLLNTLQQDPRQYWMTPIACVFGFLDDPTGLLHALVQPAAPSLHHELATHAILSNPLPAADQVSILLNLCHSPDGNPMPPSNRLLLLRTLSQQRPHAASDFGIKWLEAHADSSHPHLPIHQNTVEQVDQLLDNLFRVEIQRISGNSDGLPDLLEQQISISQNLNSSLINHYILHKANLPGGKFFRADLSQACDTAIKLATLSLSDHTDIASQAELALTLAGQGLLDEADKLIPSPEEPLPTDVDILFSIARVSYLCGNLLRSSEAASRILELLDQNSSNPDPLVWGDGFSLVNLGKLLLDLRKPSEAVPVFERALRICPNDVCLLKLMADAYKSSHVEQKTAEILNILVSLDPSNLDHRRVYALSLESLGDWEASLSERLVILESDRENPTSSSLQDEYDYAHCAIRANKPDLALKTCTEILTHNPEDSQALIYSGEAYLMVSETDQGMDCLTRATHIAPHRSESWLALVDAQKKLYPLQTVIETLKNALQAVPDSSQIHYALGDLYVQDNELTLALPELKLAVELLPDNPQFLVSYGGALKSLGHIEDSREMFSKAYCLEPDLPGLAQMYARILVDLGELEAAISPLETLIDSKTVHESAPYLDYARCVLTLNRQGSTIHSPMKALIALNEVLQMDPKHAEAKALTAEALTANGEYELAFQAYREALDTSLTEDKDWFERLSFGFGCVAGSIGKYDIAIAALQEAGQANPKNPAIFKQLSDAYISADLPEDAMKAARNVLVIDGENPDNLAWFANQTAKISRNKKPEIFNSSATISKEVTDEALSALAKAIQLAPTRADLLVQLGNFQSKIGERAEALATFASIASLDFATVEDLVCAAKYLGENEDHNSAAACLEKAITINQSADCKPDPTLYSSLAQEYVKNHDHTSAIVTLDKAIEIIPDDRVLISLKVDILLGLGQLQEALSVIELALQKSSGGLPDIELVFLASKINRCMGDFSAAIKHARMGVAWSDKKDSSGHTVNLPFQHRTYIAEIYRALLQPQLAYQILQAEPKPNKSGFVNEQDYLDFIFLHTELALETGERISPDIQDVKLEASHPAFSRWMAINARLMNKAGNYKPAEQLFQLALNKTVNRDQAANPPDWLAPYTNYLQLTSMIGAAQDLGLWDHAMTFAQQVAEKDPGEPLSRLNPTITMVLKTEFNHLCELFDVIKHKPSIDTQPNEAYMLCKQYLDQARSILEPYRDEFLVREREIADDQICRWQARADVAYEQDSELTSQTCEILTRLVSPGDTVALIQHLRQTALNGVDNEALTQIIKLARPYPRNPSVILQVALALQDSNPQDAVKSLQSVLEHNPNSRNSSIAFCDILLARVRLNLGEYELAREAVEDAISFWTDEPGWHRLAAQIDQQANHISDAISHLQEAARLAPENLSYHLELGKLLFECANEDAGMLTQALASFGNAIALDAKNVSAHTHLARAHYLLSNFDEAEAYARNALLLLPDQADLYQLLSAIALEKEDFQGAYEYASKALQISPKDTQSTVMLAKSLSAMGRHNEALAKLNAVIPLVQEAAPLHLERVKIIGKINGPQIALNELKTLASTYPDDFNILNALSKSFYEVGEVEDAVAIAQRALNNRTDKTSLNELANLHLLIGEALRQSGQLDRSIQHLSDAIQLAPSRLEPYLELGLARKERREYEQALQIFERATVIAPNDPRAPFQAGLALKESKDYKSSEAMLRRAVSLAPNDLTIRRQLAAVVALNLIHNPRSARINAQ